jgi:hypothetical protein
LIGVERICTLFSRRRKTHTHTHTHTHNLTKWCDDHTHNPTKKRRAHGVTHTINGGGRALIGIAQATGTPRVGKARPAIVAAEVCGDDARV